MSAPLFRSLIAEDMHAVDRVIRARLYSDVVLIRQVAEYIIGAGGKRLRPALVLLSAQACGLQGPVAHELAAMIEFIHTATLLHDDVVDESDLRRGRETANALFGNAASVLVGDFLHSCFSNDGQLSRYAYLRSDGRSHQHHCGRRGIAVVKYR